MLLPHLLHLLHHPAHLPLHRFILNHVLHMLHHGAHHPHHLIHFLHHLQLPLPLLHALHFRLALLHPFHFHLAFFPHAAHLGGSHRSSEQRESHHRDANCPNRHVNLL